MKQTIMNQKLLSLVLTVVLSFVVLPKLEAQQTDSLVIDLSTALEIALSENPTVKVADMEIEKKQYAKKSAYGALLPQMDILGSTREQLNVKQFILTKAWVLVVEI